MISYRTSNSMIDGSKGDAELHTRCLGLCVTGVLRHETVSEQHTTYSFINI
jgi:hypothetical protein